MLTHWTSVETTSGGSKVATAGSIPESCISHALPESLPQKMAARAHVMPRTVASAPLYGGRNACKSADDEAATAKEDDDEDVPAMAATRKPDCPMAEARHNG